MKWGFREQRRALELGQTCGTVVRELVRLYQLCGLYSDSPQALDLVRSFAGFLASCQRVEKTLGAALEQDRAAQFMQGEIDASRPWRRRINGDKQ